MTVAAARSLLLAVITTPTATLDDYARAKLALLDALTVPREAVRRVVVRSIAGGGVQLL